MTEPVSTPDPAAAGIAAEHADMAGSPRLCGAWLSDEDVVALLDGLGVAGSHGKYADQQAVADAEWDAMLAAGEVIPDQLSDPDCQTSPAAPARTTWETVSTTWVGEHLPAGPGLAGILEATTPTEASDWDLPGMAAGYRRVAAWAQARELAAVAEIAGRRAASNPKIGTSEAGAPRQLPAEAVAEVALELRMSQAGAADWTDLGCRLRWVLPLTGAALAAGTIDLARAKIVAEATARLSDEHAAAVEQRVLPAAGRQTLAQLRAATRRGVLAVDPDGAERRRTDTERQARVSLYPGEEGTATITGTNLPGIQAAAAMARITAMARALKSSGAHGSLNLLRAHIFTGLLLGTLPLIPPPLDAPPDQPGAPACGVNATGDTDPPGGTKPAAPDDRPADTVSPDQGSAARPDSTGASSEDNQADRSPGSPELGPGLRATAEPPALDDDLPGWWPDIPCPGDADAPPDDDPPGPAITLTSQDDDEDDDWPQLPVPAWPPLPAQLPAAQGLAGTTPSPGRAPAGLLEVLLPWSSLTGSSYEPGMLGRIGPVTSRQAQQLVLLAAASPATQWRVIVTGDDGRAVAVERAWASSRTRASPADPSSTGVIGRATITIRASTLVRPQDGHSTCPRPLRGIAAAVKRAAITGAARARENAEGDAAADGCAHAMASPSYRPPPRIREYIAARDVTCRFGPCGQPAWRTDIDHTLPWHKGGLTCPCNLGGCCRTHHKIKQLPGWHLQQPQPGTFCWTTPAGRSYTVEPDLYPA